MSEKDLFENEPFLIGSESLPEPDFNELSNLSAEPGSSAGSWDDSGTSAETAPVETDADQAGDADAEHNEAAESIIGGAAAMPGWLDQLLTYAEENGSGEPLNIPMAEIAAQPPAIEIVEDAAQPEPESQPEEVVGPDWQSQFVIAEDEAAADSVEYDADIAFESETNEGDAEAQKTDSAPEDAFAGNEELSPEEKPEDVTVFDEDDDDDFYARPQKKEKNRGGKHTKEFSIESDYRRDFGEYDKIHPIKVDRHHRTGCIGGLLYFLFILVSGALLGGILWLAAMDVLAIGKPANDVQVIVPEGFTIEEVTDTLYDGGLIKYKPLFKLFARFAKADEKIDPGVYELKTSYDYRALVSCMQTSSGYRIETEVTVPEGYNLFQLFALLEEKEVCTQEKLWDTAANYDFDYDFLDDSTLGNRLRLEGYLFPDTYKFYVNDDPERVINKFLRNFNNKFTEEYRARADELGYSVHDILSIAAMVEKETGVNSERATVASVIYNRLNSDDYPYLQIDATVYYASSVMDSDFSLELDCPYNTYKYEGLPGPITNPGEASIRAALYPETTNYFYYAATKDFTTRFFTRYSDFEAFVQSDEFQRIQ